MGGLPRQRPKCPSDGGFQRKAFACKGFGKALQKLCMGFERALHGIRMGFAKNLQDSFPGTSKLRRPESFSFA
jgi:hypothetical protein